MKDLVNFNFENAGICVLVENGEPWFVAADVAKALGYSGTAAMNKLIDKEDRKIRMFQNGTIYIKQSLINEPGLYQAIFGSTLPSAKKFKRWVVSEVLPSIRKTGQYQALWTRAREEGKISRKSETDTIKVFVEYAVKQGSQHANYYYMSITKGTYGALFLVEKEGNWQDLRSRLSTLQLNQLSVAEWVAQKYLAEGMRLDMHYKDIYKYAIQKVEEMTTIMGKQLPSSSNVTNKGFV